MLLEDSILRSSTHALARVRSVDERFREGLLPHTKLALRWRADGNEPTLTSITLMAAHPDYIGKSMEVGSGPDPLCGLENRRLKGYAGSSPVPSAISFEQLTRVRSHDDD